MNKETRLLEKDAFKKYYFHQDLKDAEQNKEGEEGRVEPARLRKLAVKGRRV